MKNIHNVSVFKYFGNKQHLESFVNKGEVMFNTLSYFLSCEDQVRRDYLEGSNVYRPPEGLQITLTETRQTLLDTRVFISKINKPHRVFVFCTSTENSDYLYKKFSATGCVEILNLDAFKKRILHEIKKPIHNIKNKTLLSDAVSYYDSEQEPSARHACPDQIIMSKTLPFSDEKEYRFSFAKDQNAFDVNNIDYSLSNKVLSSNSIGNGKKLILGELTDIVKIIS